MSFVTAVTPSQLRVLVAALNTAQANTNISGYAVVRAPGKSAYSTYAVSVDAAGATVAAGLGYPVTSTWAGKPPTIEVAPIAQLASEGDTADLIEALQSPNATYTLTPHRLYGVYATIPPAAGVTLNGATGAILQAAPSLNYSMLSITAPNVTLNNVVLDGNQPNRLGAWTTFGQAAHILDIRDADACTLSGLTMYDSVADSIYIGTNVPAPTSGFNVGCTNFTLTNCTSRRSRRQGLSLIAVSTFAVDGWDCQDTRKDVRGATASGVDMELNSRCLVQNGTFRNLVCSNNSGNGMRWGTETVGTRAFDIQLLGPNLLQSNGKNGLAIDSGVEADSNTGHVIDGQSGWIDVSGNGQYGLACGGGSKVSAITLRRIFMRGGHSDGVLIRAGANHITLRESDLRGSPASNHDVHVLSADNVTLADNIISDPAIIITTSTNVTQTGTVPNQP